MQFAGLRSGRLEVGLQTFRAISLLLVAVVFLLTLASGDYDNTAAASQHTGRPDQITLLPRPGGDGPGLRQTSDGYMSPVTAAPTPFTHMLLRWDATVPTSAALEIEVRASSDGKTWTDWGEVHPNDDLWMPEDGADVVWSETIYAGEDARFWQVRAIFEPDADGNIPELRQIDVNTVDARFGSDAQPATTEDSASGGELTSVAKPAVVSRTGWNCPDGQDSRAQPVYYPVNHMVVHHTADANGLVGSERSWADRVRAEWSFHTYTRDWGDVGYNYLIDPNGVIYEGRAGGDDAVAFHDTANYGSMGISLIGTYSSVEPTAASISSLVELLAWKSVQKDIDPLGRSYYYGCAISSYCRSYNASATVDNISGHRHVTPNRTTCPGEQVVDILPTVRNRVYERLSGGGSPVYDNGDLLIDELESSFGRSSANWHPAACGYGGHTFYTYATDDPAQSTNSASWRPNIPTTGNYRVYAHIPQGCGLDSPPYASDQATYRIHYSGGEVVRQVDHNTPDDWVDLGVYTFAAGDSGLVELTDLTGEPLEAGKVIFFDSVKWVPETQEQASLELLDVTYEPKTVAAGELVTITFTVRNNGSTTISGQDPEAGRLPNGNFDLTNGYVYDEGECFLGTEGQDYPIYPKQTGRFRVMLGPTSASHQAITACAGVTGSVQNGYYPWRWGLDGTLAPNETRDIVGYVRFRMPGTISLQAGIIQEYVAYRATKVEPTKIDVTQERLKPTPASYDGQLNPLAHVYRLSSIPDNLLARTQNPLSITHGDYVGSFAWDGSLIEWGDDGPLDPSDSFLIEQTRAFVAPVSGEYTFRTSSDDGSWLWVDEQAVVVNNGLHETRSITGTTWLQAGVHVLSFKYFERTGLATAEYAVQAPDASSFGPVQDGVGGGVLRRGATLGHAANLTLVADDLGGSGIASLRYSWDGSTWIDAPGSILQTGQLVDGTYRLSYQAFDQAGNASAVQTLTFNVDSTLRPKNVYLPLVQGSEDP